MRIATIIFGFLLSLCLFLGEAKAIAPMGATLTINQIEISGLSSFQGQYLTAYYTVGYRPLVAKSKNQVTITEVKIKETFPITAGTVELPKKDFSRSGFALPYNLLVFVIHPDRDFCWKNQENGPFPVGEDNCNVNIPTEVDSLTKQEFDSLRQQQNDSDIIRYSFGTIVNIYNN